MFVSQRNVGHMKNKMSQNQKKKCNIFVKLNNTKYNTLILNVFQMFCQELYCSNIYVLQKELTMTSKDSYLNKQIVDSMQR